MDDEVAPAVGRHMHRALDHLDAPEMRAVIAPQKLVVIAGDVDDARPLARLAQELLHHDVVMALRPIPGRFQRPAVEDIADEVDRVGVVTPQKVRETLGLAASGSKMNIGQNSVRTRFRSA